jgi:glycosyltransferase involved in cell wall biosynthesis
LIVVGSSISGGAEKQALLLASRLSISNEVSVLFLGSNIPFQDLVAPSVEVFVSGDGIFRQFFSSLRKIKRFRPDCQINFLYRADIIGGIAGKLFSVTKIINSARNTDWPGNSLAKRCILWFVSKIIPTHIVANSSGAKSFHLKIGYPENKVVIIPNFLSPPKDGFTNMRSSQFHEPIRLGIASRATSGKGHESLIGAVAILRELGINCELRFIGFGISSWAELQSMLVSEGVDAIIEEGQDDLDGWFSEIDLYCGVSESWESDPNSVNEAVLRELPILINDLISPGAYLPIPPICKVGDKLSIATHINEIRMSSGDTLCSEVKTRKVNLLKSRDIGYLTKEWEALIR